jgi:hypothetical protein
MEATPRFEQMAPVQFRAGTAIVALLAIGPGKLVGLKSKANSVAPPNYDCMRNCHGNTSRACLLLYFSFQDEVW